MKNRKTKDQEYLEKYNDIPKDYNERLSWMVSKYNLSQKQMEEIIYRKRNIEDNLYFNEFLLVLYEEPEGTPRPRFRFINKSNYPNEAAMNPGFIHVYQPNAKDDNVFMKRLLGNELLELNQFIQTPCSLEISCFFKTPSGFNISDKFIAEYGLDWDIKKPDWDNIGKKYSDMYNSNIWLDDSMVVDGRVRKFYSILPRVEIHLKYLNSAMNLNQYRNITSKKEYNPNYPISFLDKYGNIQ